MPIYSTYLEWELWWTEVQLKDCLCFYSLTTLPYWHSLKVVCKSRSKFISVQYPDHKCMHKHTFHYTLLFLMKSTGHGMNTHKYAYHNIHSFMHLKKKSGWKTFFPYEASDSKILQKHKIETQNLNFPTLFCPKYLYFHGFERLQALYYAFISRLLGDIAKYSVQILLIKVFQDAWWLMHIMVCMWWQLFKNFNFSIFHSAIKI